MPELPEVETVRRDLAAQLLNKKIKSIEVLHTGMIGPDAGKFSKSLVGFSLTDISRRGKLLIFKVSRPDLFLLAHLKMTGQLIYLSKDKISIGGHSLSSHSFEKAVGGNLPNKYTRIIINFNDASRLFFNDLRKFGYMKLVSGAELDKIIAKNYGPEPLDKTFVFKDFFQKLQARRISIKAALLDQKTLAGLGNIYVDEVLFASGVLPMRSASSISKEGATKIYKNIKKILALAIKNRGTTFSNYVDSAGKRGNFSQKLKVYGRANKPCPNCGLPIIKTKVAGRGTHYCAHCQS